MRFTWCIAEMSDNNNENGMFILNRYVNIRFTFIEKFVIAHGLR